jgi:hypothetical protein
MPPIVHHSCPDCLALAKIVRLFATRGATLPQWDELDHNLDAFIKERER